MNKILNLIGLATRAAKVVSGEFSTEKLIKEGRAKLVIVAGDASDNTKKLFMNRCAYKNVPMYIYSDKLSLGHAIGKEHRASLGISDENFAQAIKKLLDIGTEVV